MTEQGWIGKVQHALLLAVFFFLSMSSAWGYYLDTRKEMSLSGFAYTRGTWALSNDEIGHYKGLWQKGNLVQHRNFLTLEWRHKLERTSRELPTIGPLFQFLNLDDFDYYLNPRFEYDGVWEWGGNKAARLRQGGTNHQAKYFGSAPPVYPGQFTRHAEFEYESSRRRIKEALWNLRLYEAYVNLTKGPLFLRIGRQNLSWGETDGFRLLDQINPLDNTFGGFLTSLDERRIPLDMIRAQWNFGTVGPIFDLTLEGFYSIDNVTSATTTLQGSFWSVQGTTSPIAVGRTACGDPFFRSKNSSAQLGRPCSVRAAGPHSSLEDGRGGARITGTVHDFTFSLAHYYTWFDTPYVRTGIISPSQAHLLWDLAGLGIPALIPPSNPWGPNDPTVGLAGPGTPGGLLSPPLPGVTPAAVERNIRAFVNAKRVQITGASLSFPLNALTGLFVGPESPLFYVYTTIRSEFAYFRDTPVNRGFHDLDAPTALARYLTPVVPLNPLFLPGAPFSSEGGKRMGAVQARDAYAWNIGIDHNQWITWLNPTTTFTISAQQFWNRPLGVGNRYKRGQPPGLLNDANQVPIAPRNAAPTGPNPTPQEAVRPGGVGHRPQPCIPGPDGTAPCVFRGFLGSPNETQLSTLFVQTSYFSGNLKPQFTFFYDWSGAWLIQPGVDWIFYEPLRLSVRYNWIEGRYAVGGGIGLFKTRDNIWLELQYLLY
jgi:hypothetical protein